MKMSESKVIALYNIKHKLQHHNYTIGEGIIELINILTKASLANATPSQIERIQRLNPDIRDLRLKEKKEGN